jgi:hypothetical protein
MKPEKKKADWLGTVIGLLIFAYIGVMLWFIIFGTEGQRHWVTAGLPIVCIFLFLFSMVRYYPPWKTGITSAHFIAVILIIVCIILWLVLTQPTLIEQWIKDHSGETLKRNP